MTRARLGLQSREARFEFRGREAVQRPGHRCHLVHPRRGEQEAERGGHSGRGRADHAAQAEAPRDVGAVQRAAAAGHQQGRLGALPALLGQVDAGGGGHGFVHHGLYAAGQRLVRHRRFLGQPAQRGAAAGGSRRMVPPAKPSASSRPRARFASVTVGSVPPRP